MKTRASKILVLVAFAAAAVGIGQLRADAAGADCTAHLGGIEAGRRSVPEVTVFNAQEVAAPVDIDVIVRDADGNELVNLPDALSLGSFQSGSVNLWTEITRDLPRRTRPYQGLVSVELASSSEDFNAEMVLIHVTQFFGNRRRPKGAILFRATFQDETP